MDDFNYKFLALIDDYSRNKNVRELDKTIKKGLELFLKIDNIHSASLFLLNQDTFEFDHQLSIPFSEAQLVKEVFPELVNTGIIGKALQTGNMSYTKSDKSEGYFHSVFPLIGTNGPVGLLVFNCLRCPEDVEQSLLTLISIALGIFAARIETAVLHSEKDEAGKFMEQRIAERTIKLVEKQKNLTEKYSDLTANLSMSLPHEIRTPLMLVLGNVDYLIKNLERTSDEDIVDILSDVHENARRLQRLFEHYLLFASLEILASNPAELHVLREKVSESLESSVYEAVAAHPKFESRADDIAIDIIDTPVSIGGEYFTKAVYEILDNSFKYSEKGTKLLISNKIEDGFCHLTITDYGRGMTEKQIEKVGAYIQFERKVYEQQGSGLGFAIASKITSLHNGKINIKSALNKYTTIIVTLPIPLEKAS